MQSYARQTINGPLPNRRLWCPPLFSHWSISLVVINHCCCSLFEPQHDYGFHCSNLFQCYNNLKEVEYNDINSLWKMDETEIGTLYILCLTMSCILVELMLLKNNDFVIIALEHVKIIHISKEHSILTIFSDDFIRLSSRQNLRKFSKLCNCFILRKSFSGLW